MWEWLSALLKNLFTSEAAGGAAANAASSATSSAANTAAASTAPTGVSGFMSGLGKGGNLGDMAKNFGDGNYAQGFGQAFRKVLESPAPPVNINKGGIQPVSQTTPYTDIYMKYGKYNRGQ